MSLPTPYFERDGITLHCGDAVQVLRQLEANSVHCIVTSPPYWGLRNYGVDGQIGLEATPDAYVAAMVEVFREVRRVMREDGTLWLNLGDSYAGSWGNYGGHNRGNGSQRAIIKGSVVKDQAKRNGDYLPPTANVKGLKPKDLVGIPWRVAFALQADGWWLRQDIIWHKPNPMPESVQDRCTKSHEYVFLMAKAERYYYDAEAIDEAQTESTVARAAYGWNGRTDDKSNGARTGSSFKRMAGTGEPIATIPKDGRRNRRSVWSISTQPYNGAHFATMPEDLVEPCIRAGCPPGGTVLDPFAGSGTTLSVAQKLGHNAIGIELNPAYCDLAVKRLGQQRFVKWDAPQEASR